MKKVLLRIIGVFGCGVLGVLVWWYGDGISERELSREGKVVEIVSGDSAFEVGEKLYREKLVSSPYRFAAKAYWSGRANKLQAGKYLVKPGETIDDITRKMADGEVLPKTIRVTFPEGWRLKKMADRLTANSFSGTDFLALSSRGVSEYKKDFPFLADIPDDLSLEGFLFPDTYDIPIGSNADTIVRMMLSNFNRRLTEAGLFAKMEMNTKSLKETITLASLLESEVRSEADRKMVADLFLRRIKAEQPLQSCATLQYVLGVDRVKYSLEETRVPSPYNTYLHSGFPPGPVNNPGLASIRAALDPTPNPYWFFLSDPNTGETVFSKDFEEHKINKVRVGL